MVHSRHVRVDIGEPRAQPCRRQRCLSAGAGASGATTVDKVDDALSQVLQRHGLLGPSFRIQSKALMLMQAPSGTVKTKPSAVWSPTSQCAGWISTKATTINRITGVGLWPGRPDSRVKTLCLLLRRLWRASALPPAAADMDGWLCHERDPERENRILVSFIEVAMAYFLRRGGS